MTEKQISKKGLTNRGLKKVDDLLNEANTEQLRFILVKIATRLPKDLINVSYNEKR